MGFHLPFGAVKIPTPLTSRYQRPWPYPYGERFWILWRIRLKILTECHGRVGPLEPLEPQRGPGENMDPQIHWSLIFLSFILFVLSYEIAMNWGKFNHFQTIIYWLNYTTVDPKQWVDSGNVSRNRQTLFREKWKMRPPATKRNKKRDKLGDKMARWETN